MKRIDAQRKKANSLRLWFSGVVERPIASCETVPDADRKMRNPLPEMQASAC